MSDHQYRTAFDNLLDQFDMELSNIPESHLILEGFERLCAGRGMSIEAETAILYRIIAMQFAGMIKIMSKSGHAPNSEDVSVITSLINASEGWSKIAHDHARLESIASNLTHSLDFILRDLQPTKNATPKTARRNLNADILRTSEELKYNVILCTRIAAREKTKFRIGQLNGIFDRLRNESRLKQWGADLEHTYESQVIRCPQLWNAHKPSEYRTIAHLWVKFGLGDAHSNEAIYSDSIALEVLMTWIVSLYPQSSISSSDLADRLLRLRIEDAQPVKGAYAYECRFVMPPAVDQLVQELSEELGAYG